MKTPISFLAATLLLAGCVSTGRLDTERTRADALVAERDSLWSALQVERVRSQAYADSIQFYDDIDSGAYERTLNSLHARIEQLEFRLATGGTAGTPVETFRADDLFEPASATLSPAGTARLDALARQLRERPAAATFRVEGHADSSPVGPSLRERFPSNWELAAQRAAAVARYLISTGLSADRFEVASRGDVEPATSNATAEGRARNRRVVVYVQ